MRNKNSMNENCDNFQSPTVSTSVKLLYRNYSNLGVTKFTHVEVRK